MTEHMLCATGLGHRYGTRWVFRQLDLQLQAGTLTAILGPNGCGKSTLLSLLSGQRQPLEGQVQRGATGLSLVPQSLEPALPFSGLDMVLLGRARGVSLFSAPTKADYEAAHAALARLQASHLAQRAFASMSGGERQLVLIARAIAASNPVMLLDEPTAALDWHHQAHVLNLLRQLADGGMAIAFTTHTPQHALDFANQVLLMQKADQPRHGQPDEVLSEAMLSRTYHLPVKRLLCESAEYSTAIPVYRSYQPNQEISA